MICINRTLFVGAQLVPRTVMTKRHSEGQFTAVKVQTSQLSIQEIHLSAFLYREALSSLVCTEICSLSMNTDIAGVNFTEADIWSIKD